MITFGLLSWYVKTDSFQRRVRRRIIASAEKITGGRVEFGELHVIPFRLRVEVRNLTIHGREDGVGEPSGQAPFAHVDRLQAELKIISLLSTTVGLHSLFLEHPVVHIIDYPDGTTNVPVPQAKLLSNQSPVEQLISLSVSHIEVQNGELLWEDKKVPFAFVARDLALFLNYSLLRRHYEAHVVAGSINTRVEDYLPFVWRAEAALVLARSHIDISSLKLTSGKTEIHFGGRLQDYHDPQITGNYQGVADLGELASLTSRPEIRSPVKKGTAQFEGKLAWSLQNFSTDGTLQAKEIEWTNGKVTLQNGRVNTAFSITPERFHLSSIKASLLGGELVGDADVTNWQSSIQNANQSSAQGSTQSPHESSPSHRRHRVIGRIPAQSLQRGSVHLQLAGFPILPAMTMLSSKKLPLDRLALSGSTGGNVEILWVGSFRDAETRLKVGVVPPAKLAVGEIPVLGQIDAVYRGSRDELEISEFHLTSPGSEVSANGNLSASSSLRFSFTSHNLKEWTPLLEAAYQSVSESGSS